ncbi:MAG: hypothetical protein WCW27_02835 [Patescibacteria group bacterium]|jgi:hypothetical protein
MKPGMEKILSTGRDAPPGRLYKNYNICSIPGSWYELRLPRPPLRPLLEVVSMPGFERSTEARARKLEDVFPWRSSQIEGLLDSCSSDEQLVRALDKIQEEEDSGAQEKGGRDLRRRSDEARL